MRKSGLPVPAAVLLSGVFAASAAAQDFDRNALTVSSGAIASTKAEPLAGNPLWAIPIGELSEIHARPLFSPSRRPPAPPVLASLASSPATPAPPRKPGPDRPLLTLLGTIVSQSMEIGIFTDEASHGVILLKAGEAHDGWTLSSVVGRATFFQKDGFPAATLALPAPGAQATAPNGGAASPITQPVAIQSNGQVTGVPPVSNFVPVNTEGGSRRPPKEG